MVQAVKIIRTTTDLIGARVGIGVVFSVLIIGISISPSLTGYEILLIAFAEATVLYALFMILMFIIFFFNNKFKPM